MVLTFMLANYVKLLIPKSIGVIYNKSIQNQMYY